MMKRFRFIPALAALLVLALAGCDRESPPPAGGVLLDVRSEEEFKAWGFRNPVLGLALGASRPTKLWPLHRFAEVAHKWVIVFA